MRRFQGDLDDWQSEGCPPISSGRAEEFLRQAVMNDQPGVVALLLQESDWIVGENMDQSPSNPARMALDLGHDRSLQAFLDHAGAALWAFEHRQTLLHLAVSNDIEWAIEPLLLAGAPLGSPNIAGLTPVALAARLGRPETLAALIAAAKERGEGYENTQTPAWQTEANASALCVALTALATAVMNRESERSIGFIQESCRMLAQAGSSPNEPVGSLAVMTRRMANNFTAAPESVESALAFALSLGASWDAPGLTGALPLEEAALRFDAPLAQTLLRLGAQLAPGRSLLAAPAWRQAIREGAALNAPSEQALASWSALERFWPPMASSPAEIAPYFAKLSGLTPPRRRSELERVELFASTFGSTADAPSAKRAPRV